MENNIQFMKDGTHMSNPVAYRFQSPATEEWLLGLEPPVGSKWEVEPLYTAPPQRKPLKLREIEKCIYDANNDPIVACRNVEAAHGIKGEA
jgi:hypothetical protein